MTFSEDHNCPALEVDGLRLNIEDPPPIVLPIPDDQLGANTPGKITLLVTPISASPIIGVCHLGRFIPELVAPNGQTIERKAPHSPIPQRDYAREWVQSRIRLSHYFKLIWQNHRLCLWIDYEGWVFSDNEANQENAWQFEGLTPGIYRLRFREYLPVELEIYRSRPLVTPYVNLHLVEKAGENGVEINGIRFETIVSPQELIIPSSEPEAFTSVQFGVRVTNLSTTPYRFMFYGLKPELLDFNGEMIRPSGGLARATIPMEEDFLLTPPEKNIIYLLTAKICWGLNGGLQIGGKDKFSYFWTFHNLKLGTYWLRFNYRQSPQQSIENIQKSWMLSQLYGGLINLYQELFQGTVYTPCVTFYLIEQQKKRRRGKKKRR